MKFQIDDVEWDKAQEWIQQHRGSCKEPATAIGGAITYEITPNSLAYNFTVRCFCGAKFDATDYDSW